MAKAYTVKLGGKERVFRFTSLDGVALFRRFGFPLVDLFTKHLVGTLQNDRGEVLWEGIANPEVQIAVLSAGLKIPEERVGAMLDDFYEQSHENNIGEILAVAMRAAFYSGIIGGKSIDLDAVKADEGDDEGKGPAA